MDNTDTTYPTHVWEEAEAAGFRPEPLESAGRWLATEAGEKPYRVAVVRHGLLAARWYSGVGWQEQRGCASAAKSIYSSLLGIAVDEGAVSSADARAADYYPQMLEVPEGSGPKPGRFVREKDSPITLRQLINNTSGYMKPGEEPGDVLNYQTYGMNVLCHALREAYGAESCGSLIEEKIRNRIGGSWSWDYTNFDLPAAARIDIFGNYTQIRANPEDLCRLGWLWCNAGVWAGDRIVPEEWLASAITSTDQVVWDDERSTLCYGSGFWTNDRGRLWPRLPTDGFAAYGAGEIAIVVFPSLELVIAQSPGIFTAGDHRSDGEGILRRIVEACTD
jgi:CubicO group peptidase (beta-lactamase class C family)